MLKEQALLLTGTDDERTNRNKLRLDALGVEFDTSLSGTDISDIVHRAREVNSEIAQARLSQKHRRGGSSVLQGCC